MTKESLEALIPIKIEDFVSLIIERKQLVFEDAIVYLYDSKLYEALSNEETKLWHLSTPELFNMLENEKDTGDFEYPDIV